MKNWVKTSSVHMAEGGYFAMLQASLMVHGSQGERG